MLRLRTTPPNAARSAALRLAAVVVALSLFAAAIAQGPVLSPRSIVVNPLPSFEVDVWLDDHTGNRDAPAYRIGENVRISVRPSVDAYVYLFSLAADGFVEQVLPNRYDADGSNNFVRGGTVRTFPPPGARYTFTVSAPQGLAKVIAVASRRPLDVSTLASFRNESAFATSNIGEDAFARALRIIVTPVPSSDWVSSTALYYVGTRPQVGAYGTLRVDSDPRRGEVYVDRTFVGYTPLEYDLRPGTYDVEVVGGGRSGAERVQVRPDRTTDVFISLAPRTGDLQIQANVGGARVFLDGSEVGTIPSGSGRLTLRDLDDGSYELTLLAPGYRTVVQEVRVQAGRTASVTLRLERR